MQTRLEEKPAVEIFAIGSAALSCRIAPPPHRIACQCPERGAAGQSRDREGAEGASISRPAETDANVPAPRHRSVVPLASAGFHVERPPLPYGRGSVVRRRGASGFGRSAEKMPTGDAKGNPPCAPPVRSVTSFAFRVASRRMPGITRHDWWARPTLRVANVYVPLAIHHARRTTHHA